MSLIPGGRADKFGNRFERLWVVYLALMIIDGRLKTLLWEPLGPDGEGVECFVTQADGLKIFYQCKMQNKSKGSWTVADLNAKNVLVHAKNHLDTDPSCKFVFVSIDTVPTLRDFAKHATTCNGDPDAFVRECLISKESKESFGSLCQYWGLDSEQKSDLNQALGLLARIEYRRGFGDGDEAELHRMAERLLEAEGKRVITFLADYLERNLGNQQDGQRLVSACTENGFSLSNLSLNPTLAKAISNLRNRFRLAIQPHLIEQDVMIRSESQELMTLALAPGKSRLVFLTGDPGCGKSGVLLQLIDQLDRQAIPNLPIRLDIDYPEGSVLSYCKEVLELPHLASHCLRVHAGERRAVLLLDQLDAIRWSSRNSQKAWQICKEILDDALRFPEMSVVVVGRTMDFNDDPKIKHWKSELAKNDAVSIEHFKIELLPETDVADLVGRYGLIYSSLPAKEKEILRNCQNLRLWTELAQNGTVLAYSSRAQLLQKVWELFHDKSSTEDGLANTDMNACLNALVVYMDKYGRLDAPDSLVSPHPSATKSLKRLGIISLDGSRIRFSHQSHLDYLIVEDIVDKSRSDSEYLGRWLRGSEQTLGRRDQVRLLLQLIRDEDPEVYLAFLKDIFAGDLIRFHIQHLSLATLGHANDPMEGEVDLVMALWEQECWQMHVLEQVLMGHPAWLCRLTENGTLPTLLASQDENERNQGLRLCKGSATRAPEWFEQILTPYWRRCEPQWRQIISECLSFHAEEDTDTVFEWRLELARRGLHIDHHFFELHQVDELARHDQMRSCFLLSAVIEGYIRYCRGMGTGGGSFKRIEILEREYNHILYACQSECKCFWNELMPMFRAAIALANDLGVNSSGLGGYDSRISAANIIGFLHQLLKLSGIKRLKYERASFLVELAGINQSPLSSFVQHLLIDVLASAPVDLVDQAMDSFLRLESPLEIKSEAELMPYRYADTLTPHDPAIKAVRWFAEHCNSENFQALEDLVLNFHSDREKKTVTHQFEDIQARLWEGNHPTLYGLAQYAFLLALPSHRLSARADTALRTWRCKFGDLQKYRISKNYDLSLLVSPIPDRNLRLISDAAWIGIVSNRRLGLRNERLIDWKDTGDGAYSEFSAEKLSDSLRLAAMFMPKRYLQLGLRLPPASPVCFFAALLGVAQETSPPENADSDWLPASVVDVEALLRHVQDSINPEFVLAFTRLIRARSDEAWSGTTLDMLREYAVNHPEPSTVSVNAAFAEDVDLHSLDSTILNTVRCSAISAAAHLLWVHPAHLDWAKDLAEEALNDSSAAVHAATLELAQSIGKYDQDYACALLARACAASSVYILCTSPGRHLVKQKYVWRQEAHLAPIFQKFLECSCDAALKQAGFWVTVGFLLHGLYSDLSCSAASGPPAAQVGVIRALIALSKQGTDHRERCLDLLLKYLNHHDPEVLNAAAGIIGADGFLSWSEAPAFTDQYASSRAFQADPSSLLFPLGEFEGSLLPFQKTIGIAVKILSAPEPGAIEDPARHFRRASMDVSKVLLRLYDQAEDSQLRQLRERCLGFWDALLRADFVNQHSLLVRIDSG
jgi:hypothetical protein